MEKLTFSDIARKAGVAKSTVSRCFNGGSVKEETGAIIAKVIEDTGFEPSTAAQNLKLKSTKTIGIVAPSMTSTVTGRQLTTMDETLRKAGYSVIILTTGHNPDREIEAIEYLRSLRVDGVILIATTITDARERLQDSSSVPFLVLGQNFRHGTSVINDDYGSGYEAGRYARNRGHENVV